MHRLHPFKSACRGLAALFAAALSACGGGGSGFGSQTQTLTVAFAYPDTHVNLRAPFRTAPVLTGLDGHSPTCTKTGGTLPPGVSLDSSSCVLAGSPTAAGTFGFNIQLTADDVQGSIEAGATIFVDDPTPFLVGPSAGVAVTLEYAQAAPSVPIVTVDAGRYVAQPGDVVRFSVTGGSLPGGIALDVNTGALKGTPTGYGSFFVQVGATLTRGGVDYPAQSVSFAISVQSGALTIDYSGACLVPVATPLVCGLRPDTTSIPPGVTLHFIATGLPDGFSIDASTGVISGTLYTVDQVSVSVDVRATFPDGSFLTASSGAFIRTAGIYPFYGPSANDFGMVSGPLQSFYVGYEFSAHLTPGVQFGAEVTSLGGEPGDTYAYALQPYDANTPLPGWVSIDAATGRLTGVPPPGTAPISWAVQLTTVRAGRTYVSTTRWLAVFL